MNPIHCEDTIDRLPWLLNGSLEPEERAALLEHLKGCERCREALGETRLAFDIFSHHLSAEQLVALAAEEAPEGTDPELLRRHLESCPQCATDLELACLSRQLVTEDKVALLPAARHKSRRAAWWPAALAAGMTAVVLGGGWITTSQKAGRLTDQLAEQRAAGGAIEGNVEMRRLSAPSVARSEETTTPQAETRVPAGVPVLVSIEPRRNGTLPEKLGVKIFDARGDLVLAPREPLALMPTGDYRLFLSRNALPPGIYTVRTYLSTGEDGTFFEEYPIRIGP